MTAWEILSHQVAISGRVTNTQTQAALADALVEITVAPPTFDNQFSVKEVKTSPDGHFHFLDLPNGNYTLRASSPNIGSHYSRYGEATKTVTVSRNTEEREERIVMASVDLAIPATTLKGEVKDTEGEAVVMAKVKVQGTSEKTFSDSQGKYILIGLEATRKQERTILVKASGYQSSSQTVLLDQPGVEETLNFELAKE